MFEKLFDSRKNNTFLVLNWNSNSYINLLMFASFFLSISLHFWLKLKFLVPKVRVKLLFQN